jgi:hypothetical protein
MNHAGDKQWRREFGLPEPGGNVFFASKADLKTAGPESSQAHVVRRAFDLLKLDGVLCTDKTPLVYFKQVRRIDKAEILLLHRTFWNHGGAPILVLIAPQDVHVYSGLVRPVSETDTQGRISGLVERLDRASSALTEFLPAVESGEFFRRHQDSFNPAHRVDRDLLDNLQATRQELLAAATGKLDTSVLDALLCRLVFACYLFDRNVVGENYLEAIGLRDAAHLRDVLGVRPRSQAKKYLYDLFRKLGDDFNGDLFSDNLESEARLVSASCIGPLDDFFRATDAQTGQGSFWPYDFAAIPVEAISAIYERFLKGADRRQGAVYTPRFLAELLLDVALADTPSLLGRRYLDPAAGSGIFLVGLFNRMAEEWREVNPDARNDRRARELRKILCESLCGVDINPTACRITAFSLYLAYLDQLSPRDIQELQQKGHKLPRLVHYPAHATASEVEGNIWCGDFFADPAQYPAAVDLVIGNPPWGSSATGDTAAAQWCGHPDRQYPVPDKQISAAFVWKAAHHTVDEGRICFVLPHGTLFNHNETAIEFQRALFTHHAVDHVLNLADYQFFLFEEARHPAIVLNYRRKAPAGRHHEIQYWAPKTDWLVTRADVISIMPEDRSTLTLGEVLDDLEGEDAPQIWKQHYWATPRDRRLVDRLSLYARLRNHVRQNKEPAGAKRWLIAEGFQPVGERDDKLKARTLRLPSKLFVEATSPALNLFLLAEDCVKLPAAEVRVRSRSNKVTAVFRAPHVLVAKGFTSIAFADFDVSFRHALRGICGPKEDRDLLVFLAAYLRSPLARYFLFQTSSNWGVSRQEVHVEELLRLPFPLPDTLPDPRRAWEIVRQVSRQVTSAAAKARDAFADPQRLALVRDTEDDVEILIDEYFDVLPLEKAVLEDTLRVIIPSVRPTRGRSAVPTIDPSKEQQRDDYTKRLCETLNSWAKTSQFVVQGRSIGSPNLGIGLAILQKTRNREDALSGAEEFGNILAALALFRDVTSHTFNVVDLPRAAKVFDRDCLYVLKPIGQRFWTQTAALNDADEIAGSILMHTSKEMA